jgi:hypothetical protein
MLFISIISYIAQRYEPKAADNSPIIGIRSNKACFVLWFQKLS